MIGFTKQDGLLYVGNWLIIPYIQHIRESLFYLAYDMLGHFGTDKSYAAMQTLYY